MFADEVWLEVRGGRGGNGVVSFRREKYVPMGGPDGGDGGAGGSVILRADPSRHSFLDLRHRRHLRAEDGGPGRGKLQHGPKGSDLIVPVPLGTIVRDEQKNLLADLTRPGQKVKVAAGGAGGRGNARFVSSRRRSPRLAEKGQPGQEQKIFLELKLMAQVGLVGFPNAGKSTLLSRISSARPRVAPYPFTTLEPQLGVVDAGGDGSFVVADLPGLIEGAHRGAGLGHRFLRHVERNLLLLFLIDLAPGAQPDPEQAYRQLVRELALYSERLAGYPRLVAGNKLDLTGAGENLERLRRAVEAAEGKQTAVRGISAVTGEGLGELLRDLAREVSRLAAEAASAPEEPVFIPPPVPEAAFTIEKEGELYLVRGAAVERMAALTDFENDESLRRFQNYCRRSGIEKELKKRGAVAGDTVRIGKEEFYYYE
jgi:GTP-binding protein